MSGEMRMNAAALPKNFASSEPNPAFTTAQPAIPPSNACDDDDGKPHHQVSRFQMMAPMSPQPTSVSVTTFGSTPLAMLPASALENSKKAMKLKNAAHATAARGDITRVDTMVA